MIDTSTEKLFGNLGLDGNVIDEEIFVDGIVDRLQSILVREFPGNSSKQYIKKSSSAITFACPICGDSTHNDSKKRGTFIIENGPHKYMFKCHNCGAYMSIGEFFRRFGEKLNFNEQRYVSGIYKDASNFKKAAFSVSNIFDTDQIESFAIERSILKSALKLVEVNEHLIAMNYLRGRQQFEFGRFLVGADNMLYILNLTPQGKILGLQTRPIFKKDNGPKYKLYKLSKIYEYLFGQAAEIPEEIDKLSTLFGITTLDLAKPVTALEGPLDAFLINNAIATCGAGKSLPLSIPIRWLYDSDKRGREESLKRLSEHKEVFMWDKYIKDNNLPKRPKWDINDVRIYFAQQGKPMPSINAYFTSDTLDMIYI